MLSLLIKFYSLKPVLNKKSAGTLILFMLMAYPGWAFSKSKNMQPDTLPAPKLFTVADIGILPGNSSYYRIAFYQSARFYKLMRNNKNCKRALVLLRQSRKTNKPVLVTLTELNGDVIADVKKN